MILKLLLVGVVLVDWLKVAVFLIVPTLFIMALMSSLAVWPDLSVSVVRVLDLYDPMFVVELVYFSPEGSLSFTDALVAGSGPD